MTLFETHCEVIPKQLHDKCAVFVRVFIQCIQLSNCFIKGLQENPQNELKPCEDVRGNHNSEASEMQTMSLMEFKA